MPEPSPKSQAKSVNAAPADDVAGTVTTNSSLPGLRGVAVTEPNVIVSDSHRHAAEATSSRDAKPVFEFTPSRPKPIESER